jgi:hypothetical protein
MEHLEPFYNWRDYYTSENDRRSPFYRKIYNEFYYDKAIYNYVIHPQWDDFGSETLYIKVIYADYQTGFTVIEFIGEWNDLVTCDIMLLKRDIIDGMITNGIKRFILIGENVLNFHYDSDDYYQEWLEDIEEGWVCAINFQEHVRQEIIRNNLDEILFLGGKLNNLSWRSYKPEMLFHLVETIIQDRNCKPKQNNK